MKRTAVSTIRDVAQLAKVSTSTVSHVVNETRHVEEATKKRILRAIEELDYRPNQLARGLRGAGSKTIGLVISDIREEYFACVTKAIESSASERGYMVILCDSEEDREKESMYLEILAERGVDGIIVASVDRGSPPYLPGKRDLPIVQIDRRSTGGAFDFVGIENAKLAREAVLHFVSLGRRRLGFVGHENSVVTMNERSEGFKAAMRELGDLSGGEALRTSSKSRDERSQVMRWLVAHPALEGVVCGNANICFTVLDALEELGIKVPADIGVLSFDDHGAFKFLKSPVTAIAQPVEETGKEALGALLARIGSKESLPPREILLPARLVVRESCGECLKRDRMAKGGPGRPAGDRRVGS